jgi:eukaryotic-like serine/threonine-protein kinase
VAEENATIAELETELDDVPPRSLRDLLGGALDAGDVLADKYRIEGLIGQGAMGFVLRARHLQLDESVAVKFLLPELAQSDEAQMRFEREARAAFKIKSEHVARVLDVGRMPSGQPFLVMEFLEGEDLGQSFYGNQLPIDELADHLLQACDAVAEAHSLGIVHRDLKPENLFLTRRRDGSTCVKVFDFGLSKTVPRTSAPAPRQRAVTADAQVLGTAHYMSPEQWVASRDVGPATDIWALGVILYEALTGECPFLRNNLAAMCNAVLHEEPEPIERFRPDVPEELVEVVARCLRKNPDERYPSATELALALVPFASKDAKMPVRFSTHPPPPAAPVSAASAMDLALGAPRSIPSMPASSGRKLGLRGDHGLVESWSAILEEEPAPAKNRLPIALAITVVLLLLILAWALF